MQFSELKEIALSLPLVPGVYIMKDSNDHVIYVGKAKKLKNRVSQYFQDTASHSLKTRKMVNSIDHFDVIIAASDFEALVLECSLIKQYMPKYNILLKDDKGYPYLRLNIHDAYPRLTMVSKIADDGAEYFGPFGSRGVTSHILRTVQEVFKLPTCNKKFPRDMGKDRPCLNYHMNQCAGWCQDERVLSEYHKVIEQVRYLLAGNYKSAAQQIKSQMLAAADQLNFELATTLRNRLQAVETLGRKQFVTAGSDADLDVIGFAQTETKACFAVLHFCDGNLIDKEYKILSATDDPAAAVSALIKQYYFNRGFAPKIILLPVLVEDSGLLEEVLLQNYSVKTKFKVPIRGDRVRLVEMAVSNAQEEAERVTSKEERISATVRMLEKMTAVKDIKRIESYDISNLSSDDIVASMVVYQDGKPYKKEYKHFKIRDLTVQDDYASMYQVIKRRFGHLVQEDTGFKSVPDLVLIDGGAVHAQTALNALHELGLNLPVFGMVKDDRHRTRALVTPEGKQIRIDNQQSVFSLIGSIQEETHRFAITYNRKLRSKRIRHSELDQIEGIGPVRKEALLKAFKSLQGIKEASVSELEHHLPRVTALAVYQYFNNREE